MGINIKEIERESINTFFVQIVYAKKLIIPTKNGM